MGGGSVLNSAQIATLEKAARILDEDADMLRHDNTRFGSNPPVWDDPEHAKTYADLQVTAGELRAMVKA